MNQVTIFRWFTVASFVIALLGGVVDLVIPGLLSPVLEEARDAYKAAREPTTGQALAIGGAGLILFVSTVVATIAFLQFKRWARRFSLWLSVLGMLAYPLIGADVHSAWANMLVDTSMMLWGAALAMAYFSELKLRFEADSVATPAWRDAR